MSLAYLTPKGQVIKAEGRDISSSQNAQYSISNIRLDSEGQLEEFTVNNALTTDLENTYIYVDNTHYFANEQKKKGKTGYLKKSYFIKLKNSPNKTYYEINDPEKISTLWFDGHFQDAAEGDIFSIVKLHFDVDSAINNDFYYYKTLIQEFKIKKENTVDFTNYLTFPEEIDLNIDGPNYNKRRIETVDRKNIEEGLFFKVNFQKIKESNLEIDAKVILWRKLTSICFAIYWIKEEVLETVAMKTVAEILEAVKNGTIQDQNSQQEYNFLEVDQLIGNLLESWGYYREDDVKEILPIPNNDNYYGGYYEAFSNYKDSLDAFYHNLRNKDEAGLFPQYPVNTISNPTYGGSTTMLEGYALLEWKSNERIKVLKNILPSSALALLPYSFRKAIIESYIVDNSMSTEAQTQCLRIIHSFYLVPSEGQKFLIFLNKKRDEICTNFERLFLIFNDKNIAQVSPVIGFFAQEKTNRSNFIYGLYEIWKRTYYDFRYIPQGETPNSDGVNPNAYFLTEKGLNYYQHDADKKYYNTLEFGVKALAPQYPGDSPGIGVQEQIDIQHYVDTKLQNNKVHITKTITHNFRSVNQNGLYIGDVVGDPKSWPTEKKEMYFHLYQPINLVAYEPDQDLSNFLPNDPVIPAFVYYYCEKYEDLKNINAAWGVALDLAIEVVFFFVSGGVSAIKDLRYLKYTTEIGKSFRGITAAEQAVMVLRAEEITGEAFTLTAGMCMSASNYIATKYDDNPAIAGMARNVGMLFFFLTMLGAGATMYARRQATNAAYKVLNDVNFATLPSEIRAVVTHLTSEAEVVIGTFKSTLNNIDPNKKNLYNGFVALNSDLQKAFHAEFSKMSTANLTLLNNESNAVARWSNMYNKSIKDRKILSVLIDQTRVDTVVKYYTQATETNMRNILEGWDFETQWALLDKVGIDDAHFLAYKADTNLLEYWKNFQKEANTTKKFSNLNASEQILLLADHGNNFIKFKNNPKLLDMWKMMIDNPIEASFHANYLKKIDFIEAIDRALISTSHGETLLQHMTISTKYASGTNRIIGYTGLHFDSSINESFLLDVTSSSPFHTTIGTNVFITGPTPTGSGTRTALVMGSQELGTGSVMECEVRVWGYARENIGTRRSPNWQFVLDNSGNPLKAWVQKSNNGGKTTVFVGLSKERAIIEIAFARYNLTLNDFQLPTSLGKSSNEWHGMSSEGTKVAMYIDPPYDYGSLPSSLPNTNTNYKSAFPKLHH